MGTLNAGIITRCANRMEFPLFFHGSDAALPQTQLLFPLSKTLSIIKGVDDFHLFVFLIDSSTI